MIASALFFATCLSLLSGASGKFQPLEVAKGRSYGAGFAAEGGEAVACSGTNGLAGVRWDVALKQESPVLVRISAEGKVESTQGGGEALIYVDVTYDDNSHLWGQTSAFPTDKAGNWNRRSVTIMPDKPIRSMCVYLMARRAEGLKVRYRNVGYEMLGASKSCATFDGIAVVPSSAIAQEEFLVRDVAAEKGFETIVDKAQGFALTDSRSERNGAVFHEVTLADEVGGDRAVTLAWLHPLASKQGTWFDSPRTSVAYDERKREMRKITSGNGCGMGGFSSWPFLALADGENGYAIGIDPRLPGYFRLGISPSVSSAYIVFDMALVPEKRSAKIGFVTFPFVAKDGWRGALEAYQRVFPEFNEVKLKRQGNWMAFYPISKVEGWEDFGFAVKEGDDEIVWDDAHGITTFRYTEPTTWWMAMKPQEGRKLATMAECVAEAERLAAKGNAYAKAWKTCAMTDVQGNYLGSVRDTPWCKGIVWNLNCAPGQGADCEFAMKIGEPGFSKRYAGKFPQGLDGEYVDSAEMYVTAVMDYNRKNFAGMDTPLVFTYGSYRPGVFKGMQGAEYVRGIHRKVREIGRLSMANSTPISWCWLAPWLDVMGTETNWNNKRWLPPDDNRMMYFRALSGAKPFCFLQNTKFDAFTPEMCDKYMQRSLAYGMYPSFFSSEASSRSHYFKYPEYYNRDRALFKKYMPLCRAVGEAGWKAVNRLTASDSTEVITEQFGNDLATVFNLSTNSQRVAISSLQGRSAKELVAGGDWKFVGGREEVVMPPETVRVLKFDRKDR